MDNGLDSPGEDEYSTPEVRAADLDADIIEDDDDSDDGGDDQPDVKATSTMPRWKEVDSDEEAGDVSEDDQRDYYGFLWKQTPFKKLRLNEKAIQRMLQKSNPDFENALSLRRQCLAYARTQMNVYGPVNGAPDTLVPEQHFKLAKAYLRADYRKQALQHCRRALDCLTDPDAFRSQERVYKLLKNLHLMLGHMLLQNKPPRPEQALRHFNDAEQYGAGHADVQFCSLRSYAYAMQGEQALKEAMECVPVIERSQQRYREKEEELRSAQAHAQVSAWEKEKVKTLEQQKVSCQNDLNQEQETMRAACRVAMEHLTHAVDTLMEVDGALSSQGLSAIQEPRNTVIRRLAELALKQVDVAGLSNDTQEQLNILGEIESHQSNLQLAYDIAEEQGQALGPKEGVLLPSRFMARALKVKASIKMAEREYLDAIEIYDKVLQLHSQRFEEDTAKLEVHRAEVLKLKGNCHLANKEFLEANSLYEEALRLYEKHMGIDCLEAQDLKHRLSELRDYMALMGQASSMRASYAAPGTTITASSVRFGRDSVGDSSAQW